MTVQGILYIISAPSGAGKTTLVSTLIARNPQLCKSISHTTRAPRAAEIDGQDYYFVDKNAFFQLQAQGNFIETAEVFGNWYGTSKNWLEKSLSSGLDVILEIDWQGARHVREHFDCVSIFIFPPSKVELLERLQLRAQDDPKVINQRMQAARNEMIHYSEYDYLIVNDEIGSALSDLQAIIQTQRKRVLFQRDHYAALISELIAE